MCERYDDIKKYYLLQILWFLTYVLSETSEAGRGGSRISEKGGWVHIYKGVGVRLADFISFFLNIP